MYRPSKRLRDNSRKSLFSFLNTSFSLMSWRQVAPWQLFILILLMTSGFILELPIWRYFFKTMHMLAGLGFFLWLHSLYRWRQKVHGLEEEMTMSLLFLWVIALDVARIMEFSIKPNTLYVGLPSGTLTSQLYYVSYACLVWALAWRWDRKINFLRWGCFLLPWVGVWYLQSQYFQTTQEK